MSATGLDVFDKTIQTTNLWLNDIMEAIGPDRQIAWHVLGAVLRALRDRIPIELAAHLGSQLPILIRGAYYDQWQPSAAPQKYRTLDEFIDRVSEGLSNIRPVNRTQAIQAVFGTLSRHVPEGQMLKVFEALPEDIRTLWVASPVPSGERSLSREERSADRRSAQSREARARR
jgi:uncharacterized protein (DUF2267 family)